MITKGKKKQKLKVFIPTAGIGSRLSHLTYNFNKCLIEIGHKPAISHIIENFPDSAEFVIALGFDSKKVRDFLLLTYPKKKFYFTYVDDFVSKNSSLGYSMKCSRKYLQSPFFFVACDSVFKNKINNQGHNWIGYSNKKPKNNYRKLTIAKKLLVSDIYEKNSKINNAFTYVGIASILDYSNFWRGIDRCSKKNFKFGEIFGLKQLCKEQNLYAKKLDWYDIGNLKSYKINQKKFKSSKLNILPKKNESIWFIKNNVVKFSQDESFIKKRIKRQKILKKYTPKIINYKKNFFLYKKIDGNVLSKKLNINNFKKLLINLEFFWKKKKINKKFFVKRCDVFYRKKTFTRVQLFLKRYGKEDIFTHINGQKVLKINDTLSKINWKNISDGIPVNFHGDLHFENILIKKNSFYFLDWRQDFSNIIYCGDLYYDLAKLMHGIIVDHNKVSRGLYRLRRHNKSIKLLFKLEKINVQVLSYFEKWILENNLDLKKVRSITALIYLNIAPLHHNPYSLFLFQLGKHLLTDTNNFEKLKKL